MKLLSIDPKATRAVVQTQSHEDLWRLSELLESGDCVTGRTERKIKIGENDVTRKTITLTIQVERTELQDVMLRVSGITTEPMDDIPKGSYHTISVGLHDTLTIDKEWTAWQLEKLKEEDSHVILVLVMDREEAVFAVLRREPEIIMTIKGAVQKKGMDGGSPYWQELATELAAQDARIHPRHVIIASPAFFKEYVMSLLPEELRKKTVAATINATGSAALAELVRRPEVKHVLTQERYSTESALIDLLLAAIHKDKGAWGITEVTELAVQGALSMILVSSEFLKKSRTEGKYAELAETLKAAERTKTVVHILDTSAANQVEKLGGIAGVRRW